MAARKAYRSERDAAYQQHINGPQWRAFRDQIVKERPACECCGRATNLHVHHLHYNTLGREQPTDVAVLCVECHEAVHGRFDALKRRLTLGPILEKREQIAAWNRKQQETPAAQARAERQARIAAWEADNAMMNARYGDLPGRTQVRRRAMAR